MSIKSILTHFQKKNLIPKVDTYLFDTSIIFYCNESDSTTYTIIKYTSWNFCNDIQKFVDKCWTWKQQQRTQPSVQSKSWNSPTISFDDNCHPKYRYLLTYWSSNVIPLTMSELMKAPFLLKANVEENRIRCKNQFLQ